jgi:hypothetical protein
VVLQIIVQQWCCRSSCSSGAADHRAAVVLQIIVQQW